MHRDRDKIAVECKCVVPGQYKLPVVYECPVYHVIQILLEMLVTGAGLLWLCFYSKQSMTVIECDFDEALAHDLLRALMDVFDKDPIVKPDPFNEVRRQFLPRLKEYVELYTRFMGEFPVIDTTVGPLTLCPTPFNPYHVVETARQQEFNDEQEILAQADTLWDGCKEIILEGVELLREEATEILAFVMTNSLRLHQPDEVPYVPAAYALRGSSLSCDKVRIMWHRVLQACYERHCSVLCTVTDGQYLKLANRSSRGDPLTRLQLMKDCWADMGKRNKQELLRLLLACDEAPYRYPRHWVKTPDKPDIWIKHHRHLQEKRQKKSNNNPTEQTLQQSEVLDLLRGTKYGRRLHASQSTPHPPPVQRGSGTGLVDYDSLSESSSDYDSSDDSYYPVLDSSSCSSSPSDSEPSSQESDMDEESQHQSQTADSTQVEQHYHPCMGKILVALQKKGRPTRWQDVSVAQLANDKLGSPEQIRKLFKYELEIIRDEIKASFGKTIFKSKTDSDMYQKIIQIFCPLTATSTTSQEAPPENTISVQGITKLKSLCRKVLMAPEYPKTFLQIAACKMAHRHKVKEWEDACPIDMQVHVEGTDFIHELFCYPEWNESRNQLMFLTLDCNHALTNLRSQISSHSFKGVSKHAFLAVSKHDNTILSRAIVEDILDRQSVQLALRFFSKRVQQALLDLGFLFESKFVSMVRDWYESSDSRGIKAKDRFKNLQTFYDFLEAKLDYSDYPPPSQYIDGIPIRTFECILHGISTRFALLNNSHKGYYAARAISTLGIESWFSEISQMEFSGTRKFCLHLNFAYT